MPAVLALKSCPGFNTEHIDVAEEHATYSEDRRKPEHTDMMKRIGHLFSIYRGKDPYFFNCTLFLLIVASYTKRVYEILQ